MSERQLFMPFRNVKSKGGIFDDDAFVAGYEMGIFDAWCQQAKRLSIRSAEKIIRTDNYSQADLLAMSQGYKITTISETDGWSEILVSRERHKKDVFDDWSDINTEET